MNRTLDVEVYRSTWPQRGIRPYFPTSFQDGLSRFQLNIPSMLLMIGYLTTPPSSTGLSLSEFWAWVRYLAAISADQDMRLTQAFSDLDAHQKTILSDDFGMGVPMLWLSEHLSFDRVIDGRYFMQRFAASSGAVQPRTAKRGPTKTPDFVARDRNGTWHVIECKGTQSGAGYSKNQLMHGIIQKQSIVFPANHTGQRLACGLRIGVEQGTQSCLTIIDPDPFEPLEITQDQIGLADDAATRGVVSKSLRLSGFEATADVIASPEGRFPHTAKYLSPKAEEQRRRTVNERDSRARAELNDPQFRTRLFDGRFRGREVVLDLPRPVGSNKKLFSRVIIRQSFNNAILDEIKPRPTISEPIDERSNSWTREVGRTKIYGDERMATMRIGDLFRFELILD